MALRDQLRILVVDDMSTSRGLIMQALDSFGIAQVSAVDSARQALASLAESPVHLVISDYHMPGMDGLHLLRALRADPETQAIGFVLVTGRTEREIIEEGVKLRMNNYLAKPFTPEDLRKCIETVVGRL